MRLIANLELTKLPLVFFLLLIRPVPSRTKLGVMYLAGYGIKRNMDIALQSVQTQSVFSSLERR